MKIEIRKNERGGYNFVQVDREDEVDKVLLITDAARVDEWALYYRQKKQAKITRFYTRENSVDVPRK